MNRSVFEVSSQQWCSFVPQVVSTITFVLPATNCNYMMLCGLKTTNTVNKSPVIYGVPSWQTALNFTFHFLLKIKKAQYVLQELASMPTWIPHFSSECSKNQKQSNHNSQWGERKIPVKPMRAQSKNNQTAKARENLRGRPSCNWF